MKRSVILYSAKQFHDTGVGAINKTLLFPYNTDDETIKQEIVRVKEEQKQINRAWKDGKHEEFNKELLNGNERSIGNIKAALASKMLDSHVSYATHTQPEMEVKRPSLILDKGTGNTLFIVGSSKAGKSYALIKVYEEYYMNDTKTIAILFTDSPQSPHYKDLRKKGLVICPEGGFNDDAKAFITKIKALQTKLDNPVRFLLMFDDVLNLRYSDIIQKALLIYRNSYISTIISIQYPNLLNKSMRANVNNIFLFRFNSDETIEVAIRAFCGSYEPFLSINSMEQKIKKYKELTMDHKFIYVNPATASISLGRY